MPFKKNKYSGLEFDSNMIESILNKPVRPVNQAIPVSLSRQSYDDVIEARIGAIFVDLVDSTSFSKELSPINARIFQAYVAEVQSALEECESITKDQGIRGDCVYSIVDASGGDALWKLMKAACRIDSMMAELNESILKICPHKPGFNKHTWKGLQAGIGLGVSNGFVVKVGAYGSANKDRIWLGDAVVDACNLASRAGRKGNASVMVSEEFCVSWPYKNTLLAPDLVREFRYSGDSYGVSFDRFGMLLYL